MGSAIPPAPPPVAQPVQANAPVVLSVTADNGIAAELLARLPLGSVLSASVSGGDGQGALKLLTADGAAMTAKLPPGQSPPADGAQLSLQTMTQNGRPAFRLMAVDGRSLGAPAVPSQTPFMGAAGIDAQGAAAAPRTPSATPPVDTGRSAAIAASSAGAMPPAGLTATVLRPPSAPGSDSARPSPSLPGLPPAPDWGGTPPPGFADLAPGTRLTVRIAALTPPPSAQQGVTPGPPLPLQGLPPAAPFAAPAAVGIAPPAAAPHPAMGGGGVPSPVTAPGLATPPGQPAGPAPTPQAAVGLPSGPAVAPHPVMAGVVVAQTSGGAVQVQSPAGLLALELDTPLPVGGGVRLELIGLPLPPLSRPAPPPPQGLSPAGWPALDQAVDTLMASDRQAAEILMRVIPQAGPRLAAALSQFAGAVRSGDAGKVVSEPVAKGLEKAGRKDLADRLKREFMDLSEEASRPAGKGGEWQAITMPFAYGADIDPITLYVHRPPEDEEKGAKGGSEQRFLLEVRMSVLGRIQLDGLVQKETSRFDLIVRTAQPLPPVMCRDIAGIFAESGQLTGVRGQVSFQSGRSFVELPPAGPSATRIVV